MALIQPLRSGYSLLKRVSASIAPWHDIVLNIFISAWEVCTLILTDVFKGALIVIGVTMPVGIITWFVVILLGGNRKRLEDTIKNVQTWLALIWAGLLFVDSMSASFLRTPELNIFTFRPALSTWQTGQWLKAVVGAAIVIPSYVYLFIVVRRWFRATFGHEGKEPAKDLLA